MPGALFSASTRRGGLSDGLARLSSGLRIQKAADDAAGLGVATNLERDARAQRMALRNIEDMTSILESADRAIDLQQDLLIRARELAVQGASEGIGASGRNALQGELDRTVDELDRVATDARRSGVRLLDRVVVEVALVLDYSGSMITRLKALPDKVDTLVNDLQGFDVRVGLAAMGENADRTRYDGVSVQVQPGDPGVEDGVDALVDAANGGLMDPLAALAQLTGVLNTAPSVYATEDDTLKSSPAARKKFLLVVTDTHREYEIIHQKLPGFWTSYRPDTAQLAAEIAQTGWQVSTAGRPRTGSSLSRMESVYGDIRTATGGSHYLRSQDAFAAFAEEVRTELEANGDLSVQVGSSSGSSARLTAPVPVLTSARALGLSGASLESAEGARALLGVVDDALHTLSAARSSIGGFWRRLDHAGALAERTAGVADLARSQLLDVDGAQEVSSVVRAQVQAQISQAAAVQARQLHRSQVRALLG